MTVSKRTNRKMLTSKEILAIIEKFENTLADWPKEGGLFVDLMGKKIKQLEKDFLQELAAEIPPEQLFKPENTDSKELHGIQEIYVALYQMDGNNMARWALMLNSIAAQGISRPVYEKESDVQAMIRNREHPEREGYAIVRVPAAAIVTSPTPHHDKAGRKLLHIKPGAIKAENVTKFIHLSGQYLWSNHQLVKLELDSPLSVKRG